MSINGRRQGPGRGQAGRSRPWPSAPIRAPRSPRPTCARPSAGPAVRRQDSPSGGAPCRWAVAAPSRPRPPAQARYLEALARCELVFGVGPAGTGKTFLAVAYGASLLLRGQVDRLVVTRPAVEAGEKLGFLPGDLNEKVDPYLAPDLGGAERHPGRRRRCAAGATRARSRSRPSPSCAAAPCPTPSSSSTRPRTPPRLQMKMVLTRLGEGARMVVTGDPSQVDLVNTARLRPGPRPAHSRGREGRRRAALRGRGRGAPRPGGADRARLRRRRGGRARR